MSTHRISTRPLSEGIEAQSCYGVAGDVGDVAGGTNPVAVVEAVNVVGAVAEAGGVERVLMAVVQQVERAPGGEGNKRASALAD